MTVSAPAAASPVRFTGGSWFAQAQCDF